MSASDQSVDGATGNERRNEQTDKRYFRLLLLGRGVTIAAIGLLMFIMEAQVETKESSAPVLRFLVFLLALTGLHYLAERSGRISTRSVSLAAIASDTVFLAVGLYLLGGQIALYGLPAYGILIVMAAVVHSRNASYGIALLGAASLAFMVTATSFGIVPVRNPLFALSLEDTFPVASVATTLVLGLVMAQVASSLANVKDSALEQSRRLEEELRELNQSLERRVEAGVRSLKTKMEQMTLYSRSVAHDLRNPVTAAGELLELGRRMNPGSTQRQIFDEAGSNLMRADRMLMGLRDIMRSSSVEAAENEVEVRPVVEELVGEFSAQVGARVRIELETLEGSMRLPRAQIEHIFRNLIQNAIQHNDKAVGLMIRVGTDVRHGGVAFFVEDDGAGISDGLLPRIFFPFKSSHARTADHLGLGLALVESIVSSAGGTVECETELGQGAKFWIEIPSQLS